MHNPIYSNFSDVATVKATRDYTLLLTFARGEKRLYNALPLLTKSIYGPLKNIDLFLTARVECGTVVWNDDIDIAPEHLWEASIPISEEEWEYMIDVAVAEESYAEYVASGCKSTPIEELWKELGLDEDQPNEETVAAIEEVEALKADTNKKSYGSFSEILAETPNAETIAAMLEAERIIHDPTAPRYQDVEEALAALKADEDDEVYEKLQEAEREADMTEQRYSSGEVLQTIQENLTFRSSLSTEEIERNFEGLDLFSEIMAGLEEALEYTKGNLKARTRTLTTEDGPKAEGAFAEQILAELIASGLTGNVLLEEFRKKQSQVRPAVKRMIAEAHGVAQDNGEYYTYDDVFCDKDKQKTDSLGNEDYQKCV